MIRPMTLLFAVLPGFSAVPCAGQEPTYLVDFTVSLNGKKILEGSKDIRTGSYAEETITRAFPPECPTGEVEHGYRRMTLYVSKHNDSGPQAQVHFYFKERRENFDRNDDVCAAERPENIDHTFHGIFVLESGEATSIDVGQGVTVTIKRR